MGYGEDFVIFGQFADLTNEKSDSNSAVANIRDNDEALLKLLSPELDESIVDMHAFYFVNNEVQYERKVNEKHADTDIEHEIKTSNLNVHIEQSWSESLFYGIGNKNM